MKRRTLLRTALSCCVVAFAAEPVVEVGFKAVPWEWVALPGTDLEVFICAARPAKVEWDTVNVTVLGMTTTAGCTTLRKGNALTVRRTDGHQLLAD